MEEARNDFSEKCIQAADMAAYFVQYTPEVKNSLEQTRELAKLLDVDELHYFSKAGKICGGTHPGILRTFLLFRRTDVVFSADASGYLAEDVPGYYSEYGRGKADAVCGCVDG